MNTTSKPISKESPPVVLLDTQIRLDSADPFSMTKILHVLIVEDSENDHELLTLMLRQGGFEVISQRVATAEGMMKAFLDKKWDLVISDYSLPGFGGKIALELLQNSGYDVPFLLVSSTMRQETVVSMIKAGAHDYLSKHNLSQLAPMVERELGEAEQRRLRKLAEEKLNESQEQLNQALEASGLAAFDWDMTTGKTWRSQRHDKIFGYKVSPAIFNFETLVSHIIPEERAAMRQSLESSLALGKFDVECKITRGDGCPASISIRGKVLYNEDGVPIRTVGTVGDITEKKRVIEQLIEGEERFRQLTENVHQVFSVFTLDPDKVLYVSPVYETIWGRNCQSLYASPQSWMESIHEEDRPRIAGHFREKKKGGTFDEEYRILRPDGTIRWVRDRCFPIRNAEGVIYRYGGLAEDITERRQLDEQFLRSQRMESIGVLAGGIAHDLNNILAPVLMGCDLLVPGTEPQRKLLEMMRESALRGADLVRQVLSFARGVEGRRIDLDARHLIQEVGEIVKKTFPKSISVKMKLDSGLWTLNADPTQLHQVLMNLAVNARDAMPTGGTLTIEAANDEIDDQFASMNSEAKPGPHLKISVTDTGKGIPDEIRGRIFDPFFTTKDIGKGTGLGLSTSLGIVKSHGGFIAFTSEPGRGTSFHLYLPALRTRMASARHKLEACLPFGNGETILVVDDEISVLRMTEQTLALYGYKVMAANNGADAIVTFVQNQEKISVVLTDLMMPVMDGVATIYALQKIKANVKIIAASGLGADGLVAKATEAGAQNFLHKPFTASTLLEALREILAAQPTEMLAT